jgi:hypothetical protein
MLIPPPQLSTKKQYEQSRIAYFESPQAPSAQQKHQRLAQNENPAKPDQ